MSAKLQQPMMNTKSRDQVDIWHRWNGLWTAIFYLTVLLSAGLVLRDGNLSVPYWVVWLLTAVMLGWHYLGMKFAYQRLQSWEDDWLLRLGVIIGDLMLWFVLVNISYVYYLVLFGLFTQIFRHLPVRPAVWSAVLLTGLMIAEQLIDAGQPLSLSGLKDWQFIFMGLAAILVGIWISAIIGQSTRRRELIEQLEAAQAELAAAERREGVLEERQRLAQEIHDTLAQGFTSIVMHLEAAEQALQTDPAILQRHLDQARSTARTSLDQARRVVQDLRPNLLEQQSLPDAIKRTAVRWQSETGIPLITNVTGTPTVLHPNIEVTLLRATQEALNNIWKHAQAGEVQLTLSYMTDMVILDVQDNGVGIDGAKPSSYSGGYGLQAMEERAERCGGSVKLESEPGEGTTVVVTIPLTA